MSGSVKMPVYQPSAERPPILRDEKGFRKFVICRLEEKESPSHISYIESHETSAGIPDLNVFIQGRDVWIELKVLSDHKAPKMRPTQKRWHVDRFNAGGFSWVLVLDLTHQHMLVLPGNVAAGLGSNIGVWRAAGMEHPLLDVVDVIRSMVRRIRNA